MLPRDIDGVIGIWQAASNRLEEIGIALKILGDQHRATMVKVNKLYNDDILFAKQQLENLRSEIITHMGQHFSAVQKLSSDAAEARGHLSTLIEEIRGRSFELRFHQGLCEEKPIGVSLAIFLIYASVRHLILSKITDIRGRIEEYGWGLFPAYGLNIDLALTGYKYYSKLRM
jgi:hypothetical protein